MYLLGLWSSCRGIKVGVSGVGDILFRRVALGRVTDVEVISDIVWVVCLELSNVSESLFLLFS